MTPAGILSIVATPIGNLGDFSARAAETLSKADIIACEDTRVTKKLLRLTGTSVSGKIMAYHDHNGEKMRPYLLQCMADGDHIALVSDAGTPLISDPGYKLVAACRSAGIAVTTTPGPSAVIAGLAVSGLPTDRFMFAGFIPGSTKARAKAFSEIADMSATMIWFDAPSRLARPTAFDRPRRHTQRLGAAAGCSSAGGAAWRLLGLDQPDGQLGQGAVRR